MGKRILKGCLFFVCVLLFANWDEGICRAADRFSDVAGNIWYQNDLNYILEDSRNIITGYPDGTFRPSQPLSAEQFITMVVRASGFNLTAASNQRWSVPYIEKAVSLGIIQADDYPDPAAPISRGEMALIASMAYESISGSYNFRDTDRIKAHIDDYESIGNGYKNAVIKVYDMGVITGYPDGSFKAGRGLSRAEATAVLRRLIDVSARKPLDLTGIRGDVYQVNDALPPELYEYDYTENSRYTKFSTNQWLIDRYGIDRIESYMNIGKGYLETYYNVDYRNLDSEDFIGRIRYFFMPKIEWRADDGIVRPITEHLNYWADMAKEKELNIEMQFITDPSLVYGNGAFVIRGYALYTVKSCNDLNWFSEFSRFGQNIELNKPYNRIVEVALSNIAIENDWAHAEVVVSDEYFVTKPEVVTNE